MQVMARFIILNKEHSIGERSECRTMRTRMSVTERSEPIKGKSPLLPNERRRAVLAQA